jgi:SepF-like predicted cell division protein (DUF552 family)
MQNGENQILDLKLIRKRRNLKQIKEQLRNMALKFDFDLTEGNFSR